MAKVRLEPHLENFRVCALYYGTSKYMSTLMLLRQKFYDKSLDLNTLREDYQNEETKAKKLFPAHFDKEYFFNTTIEQDPTILNYRNLKLVVGLNRVMSLLVSIKLNNQGYYKDMDQRIEELQEFFSIFTHRIPGYWLKFDLLDSNNSFVSYHLLQVTKQFPDYFENYSKVISELLANIAMTLKFHPEIRHHIENLIDISIAHIVRLAVDK
ncbi:hypothetical protein K502DRAFT_249222 [Neoconidiobolus thromboides FSU 785]|nr:hypothetical protein K502DRAFT_249222 [Neoconidiobolus thromboides FSU 785]